MSNQLEHCPYCKGEMVWDGLSYLWQCLQPECPIDDLTEDELQQVGQIERAKK